MAETLTMEPNVETTSIENLSTEEQDSLAVGEKMQEAQEQLLAGKYKNAEELEKGYLELQQKLNDGKEEPQAEQEETEQEEVEESTSILDTLWEEATSGKEYTKETIEKIESMSTAELAQLYLEERQKGANQPAEARDFSEEEVTQL